MTIGVVGTPTGITFQHAYGFMDLSGETPARVDSIVAIASMTKLVTTVAALQLHEAGDLDLDAQVDAYLPALSTIQILVGFDDNAAPIFRTPNRRPTII
ncbi:MAG TPA: 1,4-butanediol diacrylate esterase, partial [Gammaproteobacteria bacterium]|nr:1,4-butanediol diacrylate esterase [Gammaproteobacteria bacterium]